MAQTSELTPQEQQNVRAAIRYLKIRFGKWEPMAKVLHVSAGNLSDVVHGHQIVSARLAFRMARLAKASIDDLLAGKYPPEGTCPYCGHPKESV